ncbi:DoxX family membrane protein [Ilyomonas limi]|uniref:DoxX family membrane protein n=1 Tax=Ilyomonas limi TaxID=2575867 RepID=A0A4U3L4U7_9BACT|nr:DoxX family protein [Ilyomonas limi]TKK70135.1 DoxX family membrane protein [Ilyomonas limi]
MAETTSKSTIKLSWLTVLRVVLGLIILYKAISFIRNTEMLKSLITETGIGIFSQNSEVLAFVIAYLGLLCGFFITVGLFTKASSIVQIPILIVAIFFVNIKNMDYNTFELVLSLIALILLILFAIKGSGTLSADEYFRRGAAIDKKSGSAFK